MKLLVLNGPNLNFLGIREPDIYGRQDFAALEDFIRNAAQEFQVEWNCSSPIMRARWWKKSMGLRKNGWDRYQSGRLYPYQRGYFRRFEGGVPPAVEVHLSDVNSREPFRRISYPGMACERTFSGLGFEGYRQAIQYLKETYGA